MGHLYHGNVSHNHRVESSHVFAADDLLRLLEIVWDPGTRRVLLQGIEICTLGSTNWKGKQTSKLQYIYIYIMQCIHTLDIVFVSIYLHMQIILLKVTEGFQISLKTTWKTKSGAIQFSPTYKLCTAILICDNMYQYVICLNFGQL